MKPSRLVPCLAVTLTLAGCSNPSPTEPKPLAAPQKLIQGPTTQPIRQVCPKGYTFEAYAGCSWPLGAGPEPTPRPNP